MPTLATIAAKFKALFLTNPNRTSIRVEANRRENRVLVDWATLARGLALDPNDAFILGTRLRTAAKRLGHRPVYPPRTQTSG